MEGDSLSLGMGLLVGCPMDGPTPIHTWSTLTGNIPLLLLLLLIIIIIIIINGNQRGMKLGGRQVLDDIGGK